MDHNEPQQIQKNYLPKNEKEKMINPIFPSDYDYYGMLALQQTNVGLVWQPYLFLREAYDYLKPIPLSLCFI